ncbi:MAG: Serine/threonine-protein phosphatase 1 [Bacteroidetes bacterium ADurb.Bin302]|jgi:serine/threonine protein phosphatase 1|nr:MAG: Serine/threonine-protein phosphatase 1 [Bacteroidetes bacterium ADurb.Bin302]HPG55925.1 metallophosphoesterase family protein [Candidatus Enterocola sp.]
MSKRIFAIGDIHGCFDSLIELIENVISLKKEDKLILLGDYIDRGLDSKKVLDYIITLQSNNYDIVTLHGNHESMLIDAYYNEDVTSKWIQNGGSETLKSFEVDSLKAIDPKYINFCNNLKSHYELDEYIFVHAGLNDNLEDPFSDTYSMLWSSKEQYLNPLLVDKIIIHAHSPVSLNFTQKQISNNSRVINIDGGRVYNNANWGKLIAIEVNTRTILFVS